MLRNHFSPNLLLAPGRLNGSVQNGAYQVLVRSAEEFVELEKFEALEKVAAFVKKSCIYSFAQFNAFVALSNIAATAVALSL